MDSKQIKSGILGIVSGIVNGLLGSGGGTILVPFMQKSLHVEQHKSHATTVAVVAPLCIVSAFSILDIRLWIGGCFWRFPQEVLPEASQEPSCCRGYPDAGCTRFTGD